MAIFHVSMMLFDFRFSPFTCKVAVRNDVYAQEFHNQDFHLPSSVYLISVLTNIVGVVDSLDEVN